MPKILGHTERQPDEWGMTVHRTGGKMDGETFRTVTVHFDDGTTEHLWVSDSRPGYFIRTFVPWERDPNLSGEVK